MGMKKFDEVGNTSSFVKSWQEENKDLMLTFKHNETRMLRFLPSWLPVAMHWVPFISKKQRRMTFFPQMCLKWDLITSEWNDDECPACDRELEPSEYGVFIVIDTEKLYAGDDDAVGLIEFGPRERGKIDGLSKFNKVKGKPYAVGDDRYGCVVAVTFDEHTKDKANKWQFNAMRSERIRIKVQGDTLKVRVPKDADSDLADTVVSFDLPDVENIVKAPTLKDSKTKFRRMRVDDALDKYFEDRAEEKERRDRERDDDGDDGGDDDDDRRSSRKSRRRDDDDDDDRRSSRKSRRRDDDDDDDRRSRSRGKKGSPRRRSRDDDDGDEPQDDGDWDDDGDGDDGDDEPEERPRNRNRGKKSSGRSRSKPSRSRSRSRDDDDDQDSDWSDDDDDGDGGDDGDDEPEERPRRNRGKSSSKRSSSSSKKSGGKMPYCFGDVGGDDTEDCTVCHVRGKCIKKKRQTMDDDI